MVLVCLKNSAIQEEYLTSQVRFEMDIQKEGRKEDRDRIL